jgi:hypothetical protein
MITIILLKQYETVNKPGKINIISKLTENAKIMIRNKISPNLGWDVKVTLYFLNPCLSIRSHEYQKVTRKHVGMGFYYYCCSVNVVLDFSKFGYM